MDGWIMVGIVVLDGLVDHRGIQVSLMSSLQGGAHSPTSLQARRNLHLQRGKESVSKIFLDFVRNAGGGENIYCLSPALPI